MAKFFTYSLLAAAMGLSLNAFAQNTTSTPALTFTVDRSAVEANMVFKISAVGGAAIQVDWGNGELKDYTIVNYDDDGWVFSSVSGTISGTSIKVYVPDASKINYLDLDWDLSDDPEAKIKSVDVSQLTGVKELNLSKNQITKLDVSKCAALEKLTASDNQLTSDLFGDLGLIFGNNPVLATVNVSNNVNVATGKLNEDAGNNQVLDASWEDLPALTSLNVAGNSEIGSLFGSFDISKNTELKTLIINCCKQDEINISKLTKLTTFNAQWNNFTTIDLSGQGASTYVYLQNNSLTEVKMPEVAQIGRLFIQNNALTFATLPLPAKVKSTYTYSPQAVVKTPITFDNKVDFSSLAKVGEITSTFVWMQGENEIPSDDYEVIDGVFTFKKNMENIYCKITNSTFPNLTLTTSTVSSPGALKPIVTMAIQTAELNPDSEMEIQIGSTSQVEEDVYVDWGNGDPVSVTLTKDSWGTPNPISGKPLGSIVKIYGMPESINLFKCCGSHDWTDGKEQGSMITNIDLSALVNLEELNLKENKLSTIDLSANKKIQNLNLQCNKLTVFESELPELTDLDLGNYGSMGVYKYGENKYTSIDFSKMPKLQVLNINFADYNLDFTKIPTVKEVSAIGNGITSVDLSKNTALTDLTLSYNELTSIDALSITGKARIILQYNKLSSIKVNEGLSNLTIDNNNLTFATLPNVEKVAGYCAYSPQNPMEVTSTNGKVDLASQAKVGDVETVFAWTADSEEFKDFTVAAGVFTFTKPAKNAVCTMTNAALPDLTLTTVPMDVEADGSAVTEIEGAVSEEEAVYYNLQGVKVSGNEPGVYIRRQGNKVTKVIVK